MIDLEKYKGKTLDGETLTAIAAAVAELQGRVETAEEKARKAAKESIDGRKTIKAERDAAFEKLGIETMDELQALPDAKGQADAVKQADIRIKRLERELADSNKKFGELESAHTTMRRDAALGEAIEGLKFRNPADVRVLLGSRIVQEGDAFLFKTDEGKLVPLKEGAAWFAKARPDYVSPADSGGQGSGFGAGGAGGGGGGGGGQARNPFAKATLNLTEQVALRRENPALAKQLQAAAEAA